MSTKSLNVIITRAFKDPAYRALLLRDPGQALVGYKLTAVESYRLRTLTQETLDQILADWDPRFSASAGIAHGGAPDSANAN